MNIENENTHLSRAFCDFLVAVSMSPNQDLLASSWYINNSKYSKQFSLESLIKFIDANKDVFGQQSKQYWIVSVLDDSKAVVDFRGVHVDGAF